MEPELPGPTLSDDLSYLEQILCSKKHEHNFVSSVAPFHEPTVIDDRLTALSEAIAVLELAVAFCENSR